MTEKEQHSKTVLGDALDAGIPIDKNIKKLAIEAQRKKEQKISYITKQYIKDHWVLVLGFLGTATGVVITYYINQLTGG